MKYLNDGILELTKLLLIARTDDAADYVSKKMIQKADELNESMRTERDELINHSQSGEATKDTLDPMFTRCNEWLSSMAAQKAKLEGDSCISNVRLFSQYNLSHCPPRLD